MAKSPLPWLAKLLKTGVFKCVQPPHETVPLITIESNKPKLVDTDAQHIEGSEVTFSSSTLLLDI